MGAILPCTGGFKGGLFCQVYGAVGVVVLPCSWGVGVLCLVFGGAGELFCSIFGKGGVGAFCPVFWGGGSALGVLGGLCCPVYRGGGGAALHLGCWRGLVCPVFWGVRVCSALIRGCIWGQGGNLALWVGGGCLAL